MVSLKRFALSGLLFVTLLGFSLPIVAMDGSVFPQQKQSCPQLLSDFRDALQAHSMQSAEKDPAPIFTYDTINRMLDSINYHYYTELKENPDSWTSGLVPEQLQERYEFSTKGGGQNFMPYVQKLMVPEGSKICFMGDIHGSIHSLVRNLESLVRMGYLNNDFKISTGLESPFYMIFLGDYVDRGTWSVEVLYLLIILKHQNPNNVFLLKGNHETYSMNSPNQNSSFYRELTRKYAGERGNEEVVALLKKYNNFFEYLPCALFLGIQGDDGVAEFALCSHGGIDPHHNPQKLLLASEEKRFELLSPENEKSPQEGQELFALTEGTGTFLDRGRGYIWADYCQEDFWQKQGKKGSCIVPSSTYRVFIPIDVANRLLENLTQKLEKAAVRVCIRGHQHGVYGLKIGSPNWLGYSRASSENPEFHAEMSSHWTTHVEPEDMGGDGFSLAKYGPIYTFSTAHDAGVELPYDCFGIVKVAKNFEDWKLAPYEWEIGDDLKYGLNESELHCDADKQIAFTHTSKDDTSYQIANFHQAVLCCCTERVQELLPEMIATPGVDLINFRYKALYNRTLLSFASRYGLVEVVEKLLNMNNGIDFINAQDDFGFTALMNAVRYNQLAVVKLFIRAGVDLNFKNDAGKSALVLALEAGYDDIAQLLRDNGTVE